VRTRKNKLSTTRNNNVRSWRVRQYHLERSDFIISIFREISIICRLRNTKNNRFRPLPFVCIISDNSRLDPGPLPYTCVSIAVSAPSVIKRPVRFSDRINEPGRLIWDPAGLRSVGLNTNAHIVVPKLSLSTVRIQPK